MELSILKACVAEGGNLATILDEESNNKVYNAIKDLNGDGVEAANQRTGAWIGVTRMYNKRSYTFKRYTRRIYRY